MKYLLAALVALCILMIIGIGQVSNASDSQPNLKAATIVPAATQTPQSDGTIVHTVRKSETIDSIAAAYHVTVQQIRLYNNIPSGGVSVGQRLLISISYPTTPPANATFVIVTPTNTPNVQFVVVTATNTPNASQPTATQNPPTATVLTPTTQFTATPVASVAPIATASPTEVPASPLPPVPSPTLVSISSKGSLCITGFEDSNTNHWFDNGESRLAGIHIKLAHTSGSAPGAQELTTAGDNASCVNDLTAGSFTVSAVAPDSYGLTTASALAVDLTAGAQLTLSFGAAPGYQPQVATSDSGAAGSISTSTPSAPGGILKTVANNSGLIVLAIAVVILIGGLGVVALARRL